MKEFSIRGKNMTSQSPMDKMYLHEYFTVMHVHAP